MWKHSGVEKDKISSNLNEINFIIFFGSLTIDREIFQQNTNNVSDFNLLFYL
jgi:hypothetical protein